MKKTFAILAVVALFASTTSCKKDYTCTCTVSGLDDVVIPLNDYKKGDAETACELSDASYQILGGSCAL